MLPLEESFLIKSLILGLELFLSLFFENKGVFLSVLADSLAVEGVFFCVGI